MTEQLSHDRCSEMLSAFLKGDLPGDLARRVENHLASCDRCRSEQRGLQAVAEGSDERLRIAERAALERGVMARILQDPSDTSVAPRRRPAMRLAGALGAAATIAVIGTVAYFGTGGGGDEMGGAERSQFELGADVGERTTRGPRRSQAEDRAVEAQSGGGGGSAVARGTEEQAPAPTFRVEPRPLTGRDLQKLGASSLASVRAAAYFSAADASESRTLLEQLVETARSRAGDEVAGQVEQCATRVLDTSDPTVPTFGSIGTLDGRDVLVLGFAWTRASSGPLDRYMVWAWQRGSCDVAVDFVEGKIETTN